LNQIYDPTEKSDERPASVYLTSIGSTNFDQVVDRFADPDFTFLSLDEFHAASIDPGALCVVITPDYFEESLLKINRRAISEKFSWLPFKPGGLIPWIGPIFDPDEAGCFECLLHRLRGHRVIEYYYLKKKNMPYYGLSTGLTPFSLDIACGFLKLELAKRHRRCPDTTLNNSVLSIDLKTIQINRHKLISRPQCRVCNNAVPVSEKNILPANPLKLTSRHKAGYQNSAERIISAEETCRNLSDHISPITGAIGILNKMTDIPDFFGTYYSSTWPTMGNISGMFHRARLSPTGVSTGKGTTDAQARASAMGEALERYCSQYQGYEPKIRAAYQDISDKALDPDSLITFSKSQYENREKWRKKAETGYVPEPFDKSKKIDWTPAWSLSQNRWQLLPSSYVYYNYPVDGGGQYFIGDSNGVAAGNCLEEALLQAFFELVERDAVGIWWYNQIRRPHIDLKTFDTSYIHQIRDGLSDKGYTLYCLDLTTDFKIPVVAAVAVHDSNPEEDPMIGLGAHLDMEIALVRSLSELGQSWNLRSSFRVNSYFQQLCGRRFSDMAYIRPDPAARPVSRDTYKNHATDDFLTDIAFCIDVMKKNNNEMFLVDLSRPDINLNVVRVIVQGLAHFWPRFGAKRIFEVPVKMGWLKTSHLEENLNPVPFYF
jgi:bacteriocin biosynthesis cyclodehydratase domain-containing protein